MFLAGVLAYFVAEIAVFVAVGQQIGFVWDVLLLIGVSALGPFIVKRIGLGVLARTQRRLDRGEVPTRELLDGVVVLGGGLMIMVPGFLSDALGLLLMIGPVRHVLIRATGSRVARRVQNMDTGRWTVIDIRSRDIEAHDPQSSAPPQKELL
jgi:UPF0716 protein FxsA